MYPLYEEEPPLGRAGRITAVVIAALVVVGAAAGIGLAFADPGDTADHMTAPQLQSTARQDNSTAMSRQAWARQYGQDRAAIPDMPDVASATAQQQAAAANLLARTEASTAGYADINAAKAAGFDFDASLARTEQRFPRYAQWLAAVDAGRTPTKMPMLHVANKANLRDGKILDPGAPEVLMYEYQGHNAWRLVGVMYLANEAYPQAPPDPGGPVTRWHYHDQAMGFGLMMHVFFVPDDDLAHAYALTMDGM